MTDAQRTALRTGAEDPLTKTPIHYMKSNEVRHDVWFPYIRDRGGAYFGVGSDQNYTLAAVAGSEWVFLADIDQSVVDLHRVYEILIEASETPQLLLERWEEASAPASLELLQAALADAPAGEQARVTRLYRAARETVRIHLLRVIRRHEAGVATTWMSEPSLYAHVRTLFLADRVRAMAGDLTGSAALQTAATAAKNLGAEFQVVYLSNAEEYFVYTPQFIANINALPAPTDAVVLRTIYSKDWVHADQLWAYQVQPLADFRQRLADRKQRTRNTMLRYATIDNTLDKDTGTRGLSLIGMTVAP